jgi:hypothetical protein
MSVEVKVLLGEIFITTTQDDRALAIQEAMQTISNEVGVQIAISSQYEIVGDNYGDTTEGVRVMKCWSCGDKATHENSTDSKAVCCTCWGCGDE